MNDKPKNVHAQYLGRLGGKAGRGHVKARTSEQARRAVAVRWRLTGWQAIAAKEQDPTVVLCKYNDPIEPARDNITLADAREIAKEDPSLIWTKKRHN